MEIFTRFFPGKYSIKENIPENLSGVPALIELTMRWLIITKISAHSCVLQRVNTPENIKGWNIRPGAGSRKKRVPVFIILSK